MLSTNTFICCIDCKTLCSLLISGISYLSRNQEEEALRRLNARYKNDLPDSLSGWREVEDIKLVRVADILFAERLRHKIGEWLDRLLREGNGGLEIEKSSNASNEKMKTIFFKMRPALDLSGFTSHQLRLIQLVMCVFFLLSF